jgi:L-fucose isomerase-like protein
MFGLIVGNRGFSPDVLAEEGHRALTALLTRLGYGVVVLGPEETKFGAVETWADAKKCAELFRKNRETIDGVIVTLPNFGDERGVADTLKLAGLDVPVLIHAWNDDPKKMTIAHRRDAFCGKMSVCNNLRQYGIPFSLTRLHTMDPVTPAFEEELAWFASVCRVVGGIRRCRIGALGARPAAFNTVRYSEKLLQEAGVTVETLDLSEAFGRAGRIADNDERVGTRLRGLSEYTDTSAAPAAALSRMAKLGIVIDEWMRDYDLDATAVQCWTAIEEYFGITPCTVMSMMSDNLNSSACETDVAGTISMHALALASGSPSSLLDWNNNYGDDPDACVCFHCSNLPKSCFSHHTMNYQEIIAGSVGKDNTFGTMYGRIKAEPMTYCRVSTFDTEGWIRAYIGEGDFSDAPLETFGGYGVARVPNLQALLRYICQSGFEHHVAANHSTTARALNEAFEQYLGWEVYWHGGE